MLFNISDFGVSLDQPIVPEAGHERGMQRPLVSSDTDPSFIRNRRSARHAARLLAARSVVRGDAAARYAGSRKQGD